MLFLCLFFLLLHLFFFICGAFFLVGGCERFNVVYSPWPSEVRGFDSTVDTASSWQLCAFVLLGKNASGIQKQ